jgi:transposase
LSAGGDHLLGAKDPEYLFATLQQPPTPIRGSNLKGNTMNTETQANNTNKLPRPKYVVGMDAHSQKLAISIWECTDPWNPILYKRIPNFEICALRKTYERHVPLESITIVEASTNAAYLKHKLDSMGYRAEVVRADVIKGKERSRKICDSKDADNLALAYIKGAIQEFVWCPTDEFIEYRELVFSYRDCKKDLTRVSNRIWALCSQKGFDLEFIGGTTNPEKLRLKVTNLNVNGFTRMRLEMLVDEYEHFMKRREMLKKMMAEFVFQDNDMIALMQLPGVNYRTAFVTMAAIGNINRFSTPSKLAAYGGFSPILNTSGNEELRAQQKGGTGKPLDKEGRRDLKSFYVEAGQTVLNTCASSTLGKWGWRLINRGKPKNKVVCAIARKLITYAWHILHHDPTPNCEAEKFFNRKLVRFCGVLGKERLRELGYTKREDFANKHTHRLYAGLSRAEANACAV